MQNRGVDDVLYCPLQGNNYSFVLQQRQPWKNQKTDPNMSGGGIEKIHEKNINFGDREIGALAGGQMPHYKGAELVRSQTRSTYDENQL